MPEFGVKFEVGVDAFHGEIDVAEMIFEELFILLVWDIPPDFFAQVIEVPFSDVQSGYYFFLKSLEFFQLVDEGLARFFVQNLKLHPFFHQLVHLLVQQTYLYYVILVIEMSR